ncbi:MAG TPA: ATPase [Flavobacteriales bacterium]|nr:ATPase [Flavobacteriales bacterium]
MNFQEFRERVNVVLYSSKGQVLSLLKILNLLVSASTLVVLAMYYGFPNDSETAALLLSWVKTSFFFYVFQYVTKVLYEFHPVQFIRKTWFECLVMSILIIEGTSDLLTGKLFIGGFIQGLGVGSIQDIYTLFIQGYFFTVVAAELLRQGRVLPRFRLNPALIFILSFFGIITIGTVLLMLPEMTVAANSMAFIDALFTSTSATCVTGLMVEDAATFFTFKGQVVLLLLIQLGGLNLIAFGSFLMLAARFGLGVKQHDVIEDFVHRDNYNSGSSMLSKVLLWCLGIEVIGALALYLSWGPGVTFEHNGSSIFHSIFHSISAFNSAGITLFTDGFVNESVVQNWSVHWVITFLVFFGALGMVAIFDLFDPARLRERMAQPWKKIDFATKIALYFSIGLVAFGAVGFWFLEQENTLSGMSYFGQFTTAIFQSTTRTSGFSTVNIGTVGIPMLFLFIILMFIGASSSSTGGGIKTSTFAIVLADVWRTIRSLDHVQLFQRTVPEILRSRAYSVLLFFLAGNTIAIFLLTITESSILDMPDRGILDLIFEEISAFGTVGLSTGITPMLSNAGKVIVILSMFIGRVGTLTVAFALGGKYIKRHIKYPAGHTMVG